MRTSTPYTTNGLLPPRPPKQKLVAVDPNEEYDLYSDDGSDCSLDEFQPFELDDPFEYTFRPGDAVWVRTAGGYWRPGRVSGQTTRKGQTRHDIGYFYPVIFCEKIRKYFAPLNGEIKPDTPYVQSLLRQSGWI